MPHEFDQIAASRSAALLCMPSWVVKMSAIWSPMVMTGFSEFIALWNTIAICRHRNSRNSAALSVSTSTSRNRMDPPVMTAGSLQQSQDRIGDGGLAAAGLACQAEDLALGDGEADAVDRPHRALPVLYSTLKSLISNSSVLIGPAASGSP